MAEQYVVTLDGPAGVGKTTVARQVAQALGIAYMDTGAMFRSIAWKLGPTAQKLAPADMEGLLHKFVFLLSGAGDTTVLQLNGTRIGPEIRTEEVARSAAALATLPTVRAFLKKTQQMLGAQTSLVAEGRDLGTAVFPRAKHKFFLDATPEERALRRHKQLITSGETVDLHTLTEQIRNRDHMDRNRALAPLRPADDALVIDTTQMGVEDVFQAIMNTLGRP